MGIITIFTFNDGFRRNQALGTKSALGNKRQLTNQIAGKLLFFSPFFGRHRVVLNKDTDGCVESTFAIPQDGYVTKHGNFIILEHLLLFLSHI